MTARADAGSPTLTLTLMCSDGVPDCLDECDFDADKSAVGTCCCNVRIPDIDTDDDGTADCQQAPPQLAPAAVEVMVTLTVDAAASFDAEAFRAAVAEALGLAPEQIVITTIVKKPLQPRHRRLQSGAVLNVAFRVLRTSEAKVREVGVAAVVHNTARRAGRPTPRFTTQHVRLWRACVSRLLCERRRQPKWRKRSAVCRGRCGVQRGRVPE